MLRFKGNEYRDNALDGPSCKKLLENLDKLKEDLPPSCIPFMTAFEHFNKVRFSCFTNELNFDTYAQDILDFQRVLGRVTDSKDEQISIINKMHVLFEHVEMFCTLTGKGLGFYSEQAKEAVHWDFLTTEANYQCKESNPNFGPRQTDSVVKYNTMHMGGDL